MPLPNVKVVQLTLTNRCQCNCLHCGVSGLRHAVSGELSLEQINSLFLELRQTGCQIIDLFGGEPTLRTDLFEIIESAKSYGFVVSLETNGLLLDGDFIKQLEAAGLDQIYLSLDDYRAENHDRQRGKKGSFDSAIRALSLGAESRIIMHVSVVPHSRDFFESGDINRYMAFVLEKGAEKVRMLLPRFVGDSTDVAGGTLGSGSERELFSFVDPQYGGYLYVHTPGTPLGENNVCTAKHVFCHIMCNGWVTPCPYFPLVFGDATREPLVDVFERIQSHPLVRKGGEFCPMRNEEYLDRHINKLLKEGPYHQVAVNNLIDLGASCYQGCRHCTSGTSERRSFADICSDLSALDPEYRYVEFYGGDAFRRNDLIQILDSVPTETAVILWTTFRMTDSTDQSWFRLRRFPLKAVKILLDPGFRDDGTLPDFRGMVDHAIRSIRMAVECGIPLYFYLPETIINYIRPTDRDRLLASGVERIYTYTPDAVGEPLPNAVACFGRGLGRVRLLWADRQRQRSRRA